MSSSNKDSMSTIFMGPDESRETTFERLQDTSKPTKNTSTENQVSNSYSTVFMGPDSSRETRLDRVLNESMREQWNRNREAIYIEGVKKKASERVRAMLLEAKRRSDALVEEAQNNASAIHLEAEQVKKEAEDFLAQLEQREVSYKEDILAEVLEETRQMREDAEKDIEERKISLQQSTAIVLTSIHQQCSTIFEAWRQEMKDLLLEVVRVSTSWVVNHEREAMFNKLLSQSMLMLLDRQEYTVKVNSQDSILVGNVLEAAKVGRWTVEEDADLSPGSLVIETKNSLVNNSREAREELVQDVLKNLTIPFSQIDQDVFAALKENLVTELAKNDVGFDKNQNVGNENGESYQIIPEEQVPAEPIIPESEEIFSDDEASQEYSVQSMTDLSEAESLDIPTQGSTSQAEQVDFNQDQLSDEIEKQLSNEIEKQLANKMQEIEEPQADPHEELSTHEAEELVNEFLSDESFHDAEVVSTDVENSRKLSSDLADVENSRKLPSDLADDLLAEMGFSPEEDKG